MAATTRRALVLLLAIALGALGATAATAAPPGADMTGTGAPPKGAGLGSKAALAQDTCDQATGRTNFQYEGSGPFCVNPWPEGKDNGGATAPGVTATSVKVIVRLPNEQMAALAASTGVAQPKNQSTGATVPVEASLRDSSAVYDYATRKYGTYQLWGRTPEFEYVTASGSDEAAQRADALAVVAKKPFMVIDAGGGEIFATTVASRKTVVVGPGDNKSAAEQSPYRWLLANDPEAQTYLTGNFLGRSLAGEKATWAGDDALKTQKRSFGVIHPSTSFDVDAFQSQLKKSGSTPATAVAYDNSDPSKAPDTLPVLITKLKTANVTTVVLFTSAAVLKSAMDAATSQSYRPEWIITGFGYHDFDLYGRNADQSQMAHAFGIGILPPAYAGQPAASGLFQWYWGTTQGNFGPTHPYLISLIYQAMHYAGPTLTAENVKKGLFSAPALGGPADDTTYFQTGFGRTVRLPYDEYGSPGTDRVLLWWNPDITGGTQAVRSIVGKGKFMYLEDGLRYAYGQFPTKEPKYFDESASVVEIPWSSTFPGGVIPPENPCPECPINGGSGLSGA